MPKRFLLILFIFIGLSYPQDRFSPQYLKGYFYDAKGLLTSPLHFNKRDWGKVALYSGVFLTLYTFDEPLYNFVQKGRSPLTDGISRVVRNFGDGLFALSFCLISYGLGEYYDNYKLRRVGLYSLESFIISGTIVGALKVTFHRHRPYLGDGSRSFDGPSLNFNTDRLSFPSGHSQTAFSLATVVAYEFREKPLVPGVAYTLATLVALSRVNDQKHWFSDVFVGSLIGYYTAKFVEERHRRVKLLPFGKGVSLLLEF